MGACGSSVAAECEQRHPKQQRNAATNNRQVKHGSPKSTGEYRPAWLNNTSGLIASRTEQLQQTNSSTTATTTSNFSSSTSTVVSSIILSIRPQPKSGNDVALAPEQPAQPRPRSSQSHDPGPTLCQSQTAATMDAIQLVVDCTEIDEYYDADNLDYIGYVSRWEKQQEEFDRPEVERSLFNLNLTTEPHIAQSSILGFIGDLTAESEVAKKRELTKRRRSPRTKRDLLCQRSTC